MKRKKMRKKKLPAGQTPKTGVYLNGRLLGFHENGEQFVAELRNKRRKTH